MASSLFVLLSLALFAVAIAAPLDQPETTTTGDETLVEIIEVVEEIPVLEVIAIPTTTDAVTEGDPEAKEADHKVVKRSALRGDNPSNDLLANLDGLQFDTGLSSLDGRRIKFLPAWLG